MPIDSGLGPGTILDGKYEILTRIGAGGMGEVFKARHLHLNAFRCIKVMRQGLLADDVYRMRFLREARLAVQIHHPNIAVVHDFFVGDGGNYMVTEFIDGTTLRQWSAKNGPFPIPLAADVASQVLAGLEHIHRRGLLHRDISPDNVMLSYDADERLEAKIIDLGIAKDTNTAPADKTMAGVLIGNPKYMSPEQLGMMADHEELDGRTDLYSLGVVLYEMLLGVPPFASETPQGYIMKHLTEPPTRFAAARPGMQVANGIEQIVLRALEKDRTRRFKDARELAAALEPFLAARAGTLTRGDVSRLRENLEKHTLPATPVIGPNDATIAEVSSTEIKVRAFERMLLDEVQARERDGDRHGLKRLAEAHPPETPVGKAARAAMTRYDEDPKRKARQKAEDSAYAILVITRDPKEVASFLTQFPDSPRFAEVSQIAAELKRETEPRDFTAAWETGTTFAWDQFFAEHPESSRLDEARRYRQEAADFELATATNTPVMWRAFLKTWPEGRHRLDAALRAKR